jgi:hypothetical protein
MRIISDMDLLAFNFGLEPPLCQPKREVATLQNWQSLRTHWAAAVNKWKGSLTWHSAKSKVSLSY